MRFDKENALEIPLYHRELRSDYPVLKNALSTIPGVTSVSGSAGELGFSDWENEIKYHGNVLFKANWLGVNYNFIKTMRMDVVSGRDFSRSISSDTTGAIIINEAAAERLGNLGLLDKSLKLGMQNIEDTSLKVIGVVRNFNFLSLYHPLEPFFFVLMPKSVNYIYVRLSPVDVRRTMTGIEDSWKEVVPEYPLEYRFLDEQLNQDYRNDRKVGEVFTAATVLSIFISALGLFGLCSFTAERRVKEVGIRKTLGASAADIILLLTKEFALLMLAANLVAWPVAYYFMTKWLHEFAYKIDLNALPFCIAAGIALTTSLAVVGLRAAKAATANLVEALRYE